MAAQVSTETSRGEKYLKKQAASFSFCKWILQLQHETMELCRFLYLLIAISLTVFGLFPSTPFAEPVSEMQQIKLRIARLESILEEQSQKLNERILYLEECEKRLDEMSEKIHSLQSTLSNMKAASLHAEKRIMALEEEVQLLWANLRRNNFDIHVLESKAQDTEDRLGEVTSRVEKMGYIVSEQWIHVQHLEQALHIAKIRTRKAVRQAYFSRCTFLKFIDNLLSDLRALESYLFGKGTISVVMNQLKRLFSMAKMYHHELQGIIKDFMRRHELTATFAHDEFVFFLVSALITFPLMSAWMLLSS